MATVILRRAATQPRKVRVNDPMLIYYIMLALVCAAAPLCGKRCGKWGRIVYCVFFAVLFTVISAVRFQVGYDFNPYGEMYSNMAFMDIDEVSLEKPEKGFFIPMYLLSLGFESYWSVFVYTSVLIYPLVFAMICKNSAKPWISVCAFLCFGIFFNSLCFLRQFIAAVIITYAIKYVGNKDYFHFLIFAVAASAFHWSALVMTVVYFFIRIRPSRLYLGIVTAGTALFCIFSRRVMLFLIEKFDMYKSYNPDTNPEASMGLPMRYTVMFGVLFIVCFLFRKRLIEKNPNNGIYINCLMFTTVFEAMGLRHAILSRFALLTYLPPILYLLPDAAETVFEFAKEKKGRIAGIVSASAAALFSVGCYTMLMLSNYNGTVPYTSQFNRPYDIFEDIKATEEDEYEGDDEDDYGDEDGEDGDNDIGSEEDEKIVIDTLPEFQ